MVTLAAWWFADRQTRGRVEMRLTSIGQSLSGANYPLTPSVLRAVSELTDTQLILLDGSNRILDTTLAVSDADRLALELNPRAMETSAPQRVSIDHAFIAPDERLYHAGWVRFEGADSPNRISVIAWVGILMDQKTVDQMRWQALTLPLITELQQRSVWPLLQVG